LCDLSFIDVTHNQQKQQHHMVSGDCAVVQLFPIANVSKAARAIGQHKYGASCYTDSFINKNKTEQDKTKQLMFHRVLLGVALLALPLMTTAQASTAHISVVSFPHPLCQTEHRRIPPSPMLQFGLEYGKLSHGDSLWYLNTPPPLPHARVGGWVGGG
jgi:hypothetical protein